MDNTIIRGSYEVGFSETQTEKDGEKSFVHYISTPTHNRNGHIINQYGIDDTNYSKNPIILFNHNDGSNPFIETTKPSIIGNSIWRKANDKGYVVKSIIYRGTDLTDDYHTLVSQGYSPAWSIGARILEDAKIENDVPIYNKVELLEYSWVLIPADPNTVGNNFTPKSEEIKNFLTTLTEKITETNIKNEFEILKMKYDEDVEALKSKNSELENRIEQMINKISSEQKYNQEIINKQERDKLIQNLIDKEFKRLLGKV